MVGLSRVWLTAGLVVSLTAALLVGLPSQAGAVAGYGDVGEGAWYTDAVQWSTDNGIADIAGFCFAPETPVSRGDEFPPETLPPDDPPQARGQDLPGVDLAPATTAGGIGPNDLQPFLLDGADLQPAAYRPGDWLEPKDGSAQRMMIAGVNQVSATEFSPSTLAQPHHVDQWGIGAETPRTTIMAYLRGASEDQTPTAGMIGLAAGDGPQVQSDGPATITQLLVVCMQQDREIPIRGARYFSQPKPAEGPVQTCQRNCVLNQREFIQQCVWQCEDTDQLASAFTDSSH